MSRWPSWAPRAYNGPYRLCGRKATLNCGLAGRGLKSRRMFCSWQQVVAGGRICGSNLTGSYWLFPEGDGDLDTRACSLKGQF